MVNELYITIFKLICITSISLLLAMISEICTLIVYMRKLNEHMKKAAVVNYRQNDNSIYNGNN